MALPKVYQKAAEGAIASYNYVDIAEGVGNVIFLGGNYKVDTTDSYFLSSAVIPSNDIKANQSQNTTSFVKIRDLDFDATFNMPQRIKGDVKASLTLGFKGGAAAVAKFVYAIIKVKKAATEIANAQTETYTVASPDNTLTYSKTVTTYINIPTIQHFKKGETLRITVELWAKLGSGSTSCYFGFGHDPKDRNDDGVPVKLINDEDTTKMEVHVPFVLDL